MKKVYHHCVILIVMWLCVPWYMQAASNIIWQQDFSSQTTTIDTLIQKGWSTSGSAPYSWTLKSYGRTGKSLILDIPPGSGVDESKTVELKTPNIQLDDNAQLTFWYYNKFDGDISVYVSLDGGKTWTDNALKKGLSQASSWTKVACSLTDYPSKTVQIVFAVTGANKSQYQQSIRIDDILIDEAPLCKKTVNLFVDQIKQTSAVLHWDLSEVGAETEQYILNVTDVDGNEISNNTPILAPNRSTTITGLNANTEYIVTLTADCSDDHKGSSDPSEKLRFTTIVDPMAIPLETFDAERKLPLGWSSENSTMDQYTKYGDNGYSVKIQATKDRDAKLFSPPIVNAANDTYVSFRLYSANEGSIYQVGLTSDPSDVTAFESLWRDTVKIAKQWIDIRVNMADTKKYGAEQGKHIVIFIPKGNYTVLNVDHFSVSSIPACPRAERLKIMDIDSTSCRISWLDYASSASKYEVRVVDVANLDTTYRDDVTSRPADIAGLVGSTEYELSVRPVCSDGEEIDWSLPVKFTTECQTVPAADFKEDFNLDRNRLPQCWTALSASEGNKLWDIYGYVGKNSSAAARFNRYFGESSLLISRPFSVSEIGKYDVSFEIKRPSFGTVEGEGIRLWISNTTDTVGAQCCEFINNGYQFPPVEKTPDAWYKYVYNIQRQGTVYLIFEAVSKGAREIYIDDINVYLAPSCRPVKGVDVGLPTTSSIDIKWQQGDKEKQWVVNYELTNKDDGSVVSEKDTVVPTIPFTIKNMSPATKYGLTGSVAALCSIGDTSEYKSFKMDFMTECLPVSDYPFVESFEGSEFPHRCWTKHKTVNASANADWKLNLISDYSNRGSYSARMDVRFQNGGKHDHIVLTLPQFDIPADGDYRFAFYMYRGVILKSAGRVRVWSSSISVLDTLTATKLLDISSDNQASPECTQGFHYYEAKLPGSGLQYIFIEGINGESPFYIDDVIVEPILPCDRLASFTVDSVYHSAARVKVNDNMQSSGWLIEYGTKGFELGSGKRLTKNGDNTIRISDLLPDTEYDVYARRYCGEGSQSFWNLDPQSFRTLCAPADIPTGEVGYFDDFENKAPTDGRAFYCYIQEKISGNADFAVCSDYIHRGTSEKFTPVDGTQMVKLSGSGRENRVSWLFHSVVLKAGVNYEISAYVRRAGSNKSKAFISYAIGSKPETKSMQEFVKDIPITLDWNQQKGYITVPTDGTYYLGLKVDVDEISQAAFIDNLRIREVECIPPVSSQIESCSVSDAVISWESSVDKWEIKVNDDSFDPNTSSINLYQDTLTERQVTVSDLRQNTKYYYAIRSICGDEPSDYTRPSSFRTACDVHELPLSENFEDVEMNDFVCWSAIGDGGSYSRSSQFTKKGTGALKVKNMTIISPELKVTTLTDVMFNGWIYCESAPMAISVGVVQNPQDLGNFEPCADISIAEAGKWVEFTALFDDISEEFAQAKYVAVVVTGDADFFFDDLLIDHIPTCPKPTDVVISDITTNSCSLAWTANAEEEEKRWRVTVNQGQIFVFDTIVTTNPATIVGLNPSTEYTLGISALCSAQDMSRTSECGTFMTECAPLELPYELTIQPEAKKLPLCWELGESVGGDDSNVWKCFSNRYICYMYYDWLNPTAFASAILQTAEFDLRDLSGAHLMVKCTNYQSDTLDILLSTDGGERYNERIGQIPPTADNSHNWYRFDISDWIGNNVRVGLRAKTKGRSGMRVEVSALTVEPVSSCVRPYSIRQIAATETSVTVEVIDTTQNDNWELVVGLPGFDPDKAVPRAFTDKSNCEYSGLQSSTNYEIYARSICDNTHSYWRGPVVVRTSCPDIVSLPYYDSFEVPELNYVCFDILNQSEDNYVPKVSLIADEQYVLHGEQALEMTSSNTKPIFVVLPHFDMHTDVLKISFNYRNQLASLSSTKLELGILPDVSDFNSFISLHTYDIEKEWQNEVFKFNRLDPQYADARIAFKYGTKQSHSKVYLDNIVVDIEETCPGVKLYVDDVSQTDATLRAVTNADKFQVAYGRAGLNPEECQILISDNSPFSIPALVKATNYVVYARGICGVDTGVWSQPLLFMTDCDAISTETSYEENFDSYSALPLPYPPCYVTLKDYVADGLTYPILTSSEAQSETYSLMLNGDNVVALPEFDVPAHYLNVSFSVKGTGILYVGIQNSLDADAEFIPFDTVKAGVQFLNVDCDLSLTGQPGKYVVLRSVTNSGIYIDDVKIRRVTDCFAPRNVRMIDLADTSAVITWTAPLEATTFGYSLSTQSGEVIPSTAHDGDTLTLGHLLPATDYTLCVKALCGTETTTCVEFSFTTKALLASTPYNHGFADDEENARWHFLNHSYTNRLIIGDKTDGQNEGNRALYVSADGTEYAYTLTEESEVFAYRTFVFSAGLHAISFDWKSVGDRQFDCGRLLLFPESASLSDYKQVLKGTTPSLSSDYIALDGGCLSNSDKWSNRIVQFDIESPGRYNLVVAWKNNNDPNGTQPPLAIDNIVCQKLSCSMLGNIRLTRLTHSSAQIAFDNDNFLDEVEYRLCTSPSVESEPISSGTVTKDTIELNEHISPDTDYYLYLRPVCDADGVVWQSISFTSLCIPLEVTAKVTYTEGFDTYADSQPVGRCWRSIDGQNNWKIKSESSHGKPNCAVNTHVGQQYLLRDFYLEADASYLISAWAYQESSHPAKGKLGIVVVENGTPAKPLATVNVGSQYVLVEHEMHVTTSGIYTIGFMAEKEDKAKFLCIDDIRVKRLPFGSPRNLNVSGITTSGAMVDWQGEAERYQVVLSYSGGEEKSDSVVDKPSIFYTDLRPSTLYDVKVRGVSLSDTSAWSSYSFSTSCGVLYPNYEEDFSLIADGAIPLCWDNLNQSGETKWTVTSGYGTNRYVHLRGRGDKDAYGTLRSVPIFIDETSYSLSFRYHNTTTSDTLSVFISTDSCKTYSDTILTSGRSKTWTDFSYDLKPFAGQTIMVAFKSTASDKTGTSAIDDFRIHCRKIDDVVYTDTVCQNKEYDRYGFKLDAAATAVSGKHHFERYEKAATADECDQRFVLELLVPPVFEHVIFDTICDGDVYSKGDFADLEKQPSENGTYKLESETSFGCDSIVKLHLHVIEPEVTIFDTICEGDNYDFDGKLLNKTGLYFDTTFNSRGCQIITNLSLVVIPRYHETWQTVCYGDSLRWNDTILTTTGRYSHHHTTPRGCDSIEILNFTVKPDTFTVEASICRGVTYPFGSRMLYEPGIYTETYSSPLLSCDSVVKLILSVTEPDTVDFNDYSCQGYPYTGYGHFDLTINSDTLLLHTIKDTEGCNSIERVAIDFIETIVVDTAVTSDGPYDFGGNTYTKSGTYTHTFYTAGYGCDSIVHLTLTVSTGLDLASARPLTLVPNPVSIDDITYIHRTWTSEEQHNLTVEIINSVGQILTKFNPEYYPITIRTPHVAGIYHIRITTGTGDVYLGRLIVR